jgi:putative spermidine/putrescine transport system substrate-binding protein
MRSRVVVVSWLLAVLTLALVSPVARAQNALVVSVWGGNWKDTVEKVVGKAFTAKTGIPVEYEVGGTIDRLAKARVAKGNPLVDLNFTTTHVARLYISDGLYDKLDMAKIPSSKEIAKEAFRSDFHIGSWAYVYTIVYRPDLVKEDITKWSDLWKPSLKGKIAMPDFDPSHIITIAALMEGGNEVTWQKGEAKLKQLKESMAAFYSTDAQSQDLMKTGQGPVQVMLSVNAYHLQEQGIAVKVVQPTDYPGVVGIDTMAVMAGTQEGGRRAPVHQPGALEGHPDRAGQGAPSRPGEPGATVPANLKGQPASSRRGRVEGARLHHERRGAAKNLPAGGSGSRRTSSRSEAAARRAASCAVFAAALARCSAGACSSSCPDRCRRAASRSPTSGACWRRSTSAPSATRCPECAHHRADARRRLSGRLRAGAHARRAGCAPCSWSSRSRRSSPGPSCGPTPGCSCSATPSSRGRCRCCSPSAACSSGSCTSPMPTMILIARRRAQPHRPGLRAGGGQPGRLPARVFWRVTLPLSMPGIVAGALIVFAWTLSAFPRRSCWAAAA